MTDQTAEIERLLDLVASESTIIGASVTLAQATRDAPTEAGDALLWATQQLLRLSDGDQVVLPFWVDRYGAGSSALPPEHRAPLIEAATSSHASTLIRGHMGQLLWRTSPGRDMLPIADAGMEALLELGGTASIDAYERYGFLVAAVDLAARRGDYARKSSGMEGLLALSDEVSALVPDDHQPGTLMMAMRHFLLLGGDRGAARSRLDAALDVFASDSHVRQDIASMVAALSTTAEERVAVADAEITRLLADAVAQPGYLKENTLRRAMALARSSGLRDRAGDVSAQLADITPDDYDFKAFDHTISFSGDEIRGMLGAYQPGQDIRTGFLTLGSRFPRFLPAHQRTNVGVSAIEQIATPALVSRHGHTEHVAVTEEQRLAYRLRREDNMEFQIQYPFISEGMRLMLDQPDGLAAFREAIERSPLLSDKGKQRAHKALDAYVANDWDTVSDTLPTIEAAIRMLCGSSGINVYAPAGEANEFKTLGGLLMDLATADDEQARRFAEYWRFALVDRLGLNIRNDYLHGLQEDATQMTATVILHIYAQLVFFISGTAVPEEPPTSHES